MPTRVRKKSARRSAGICKSCTWRGQSSCRAWSGSRSDRLTRPEHLFVGAIKEGVSHTRDVVANHSMRRQPCGLFAVVIGQALGLFQKKLEQLRDHAGGSAAGLSQDSRRINVTMKEA